MAVATVPFKRNRAHVVYKTKDGKRVPGTTTITAVLDKSRYLIPWANDLGLQGINANDYRDSMAGIGTLTHARILAELTGEPLVEEMQEYAPKEVALSDNAMLKFYEWQRAHDVKPMLVEVPLVSEQYRYGGTIDCFCWLDGRPALVDFKTSKAIYPEMQYQLAAYRQLLIENGNTPPESCRILRIGRDESEGFDEKIFGGLDRAWQVFWHLRQVYELTKKGGN